MVRRQPRDPKAGVSSTTGTLLHMVADSTRKVQIFMLPGKLHHESLPVKSWRGSPLMDADILASIDRKLATAADSSTLGLPNWGCAAARRWRVAESRGRGYDAGNHRYLVSTRVPWLGIRRITRRIRPRAHGRGQPVTAELL